MPVEEASGNMFDADVEALVNPVNCVGVSGKGLALQFKRKFPDNFEAYYRACWDQKMAPGKMLVFDNGADYCRHRYIFNFPTKRHWRELSRMSDVYNGIDALAVDIRRLGINSIAIPGLGCGLGGLDWDDVRAKIWRTFAAGHKVRVLVFPPGA